MKYTTFSLKPLLTATVILLSSLSSSGLEQQTSAPSEPLCEPKISVVERGSGVLTIQIEFPELSMEYHKDEIAVGMGSLPRIPCSQGILLPVFNIVLPIESKAVQLSILNKETDFSIVDSQPARFEKDVTHDVESPREALLDLRNLPSTNQWVKLSDLGEYRKTDCSNLTIYPVRWDNRKRELTYLKTITLNIQYPDNGTRGKRHTAASRTLNSLSNNLPVPNIENIRPGSPPQTNSSSDERLKIYVSAHGLYHLSYNALRSWGVDTNVDPRTYRLINRGVEVPIYVAGEADGRLDENDYIEFWGERLNSTYSEYNETIYSDLYTDVNVYWLSWSGTLGSRLIEESGEITEANPLNLIRPTSFPYKIHAEENQYYNRLSQVGPEQLEEHWYWDSGIEGTQQRNYSIFLPDPDTDALINTEIRVAMMGLTYSTAPADPNNFSGYHHAYVYLNDMTSPSGALQAGTGDISTWRGQTGVLLEAMGSEGIRTSSLNDGNNALSILCPGDTRSLANDRILLNWFEITYPRLYRAYNNSLRFSGPANANSNIVDFRLDRFETSQIDIYKIGQSKIINAEITPYIENGMNLFKVHFQDVPFGNPEYIAIAPNSKLAPDSVELDPGSNLLSEIGTGEPVKLLIITNRFFENHSALNEYMMRRNAGLGRTELIFIDDIFDEMSDGIYTPQAVKDLLSALETPPEFLLLVGDASYDTRNTLLGLGGNLVAAPYVQTKAYGAVASDFWYSLLDEDNIPDVAVGRISARTGEELSFYLQKLYEYETETEPGQWRNTHLYVTGTTDNTGNSFLGISQEVISKVEDNVFVERLGTEPLNSPFYGSTTDLIDLFDEGALAVDYNGHGAGSVWSDNSLFRLENLPQLSNRGLYPFVTNFTCFIGAFDNPAPGTILGEEFIFTENKGAIAVLASTGLGWFYNGGWLQQSLAGLFYDDTEMRLGEIVNASKIAYYAYYGQGGSEESFDTIHLMNLLGDPSLKVAFAEPLGVSPAVTPEFSSEDDQVELFLPGDYSNNQGTVRLYNENDYSVLLFGEPFEAPLFPSTGTEAGLTASFLLPSFGDSAGIAGGTYRVSLWNTSDGSTYTTAAPLYLLDAYQGSSYFDSLLTIPTPVDIWDSFHFVVKILDPDGVQSAWAHYRIEDNEGTAIVEHDSLEMSQTQPANWYETTVEIDSTIYPYHAGDRFIYWVEAVDENDSLSVSGEYVFHILNRLPNPDWVESSLRMEALNGVSNFAIDVINADPEIPDILGVDIDSVDVAFYWHSPGGTTELIGFDIIRDLSLDSIATVYLESPFTQPGIIPLEVRINEQGWLIEDIPTPAYSDSFRVDHFNLSLQNGTGDTLSIREIVDIVETQIPGGAAVIDTTFLIAQAYLPPNPGANSGGVFVFRPAYGLELSMSQAGLSFAVHNAHATILPGVGFEIDFLGDIASGNIPLWLSTSMMHYDTLISLEDIALHYQDEAQLLWQTNQLAVEPLPVPPGAAYPTYRFVAETPQSGYYSLLQNGDKMGPNIEITVEGQIYTAGGYVPSRPKISAILQDPGGMNFDESSHTVLIDGQPAETGEVTITNASDGQVMTLSFRPNSSFNIGAHTFFVKGEDLFGNPDSTSINFQVIGDFRLDFIGNYPNPFKDNTYFAYRLTEQTTEPIEIRIYTVSGRLIRKLRSDSAQEINYGEIYWDGRDEDGKLIANGVYFYKITAHRGDKKIERTMKLAKLR